MAFQVEVYDSRIPEFTGREGVVREYAPTRDYAAAVGEAVMNGRYDPFHYATWHRLTIQQRRDATGRFIGGWVLTIEYTRPGPGDDTWKLKALMDEARRLWGIP